MIALAAHPMLPGNALVEQKYHCIASEPAQVAEVSSSVSEGEGTGLPCLPRRTVVLISGNNRTKKSLVGQQAIVKRAVGLGGWHHCVSDPVFAIGRRARRWSPCARRNLVFVPDCCDVAGAARWFRGQAAGEALAHPHLHYAACMQPVPAATKQMSYVLECRGTRCRCWRWAHQRLWTTRRRAPPPTLRLVSPRSVSSKS